MSPTCPRIAGGVAARAGLTLIEMIVALLLVGLLALSFALSVVPISEALLVARRQTESVQKAQHAIGRLVREFSSITNVVSGTGQSMIYDTLDGAGVSHRRTVSWSPGQPLSLNNVPLSDDAGVFALRYYDGPGGSAQSAWSPSTRIAEIILQSQTGSGIIYSNRVHLRYLD